MRRYGVLVISHGSRDAEWIKLVRDACAELKLPPELAGIPMECAFLELCPGHLIQDGIDRLEEHGVTDIVAVPMFISSGSTHIDEIAWALGTRDESLLETELQRFRLRAEVHLGEPIGDDPEIAKLLCEKLAELSKDPARELVMIVGHGSKEKGFHARWRQEMSSLAAQVKALGGFAETEYAMLLPDQAACKLKAWQRKRPELEVIVAPLFLSEGYFTNTVVPRRLAGFQFRYTGNALLPSPYITQWLERRITDTWKMIERIG